MSNTTNKNIEKPAYNSYVDAWNSPVNADFDIIDAAFGSTTSLNATGGSATLSANQYQSLFLSISGAIAAPVTYTIPSGVGGQWIVYNGTTDSSGGPHEITIASGGGGTSITVTRGNRVIIISDGTNIRKLTYIEGTYPLAVEFGGTGLSSPGASGNVLTSTGTGWASSPSIPTGSVITFAGSSAPSGWLLCFGQAISRSTYADLFAAISTIYGSGDGSTTFNLPDLRGRVAAGKDDMGGSAANRITNAGSGITGTTLGASGGSQNHALTLNQLPSFTQRNPSSTTNPAFGDNTPLPVAANVNQTIGNNEAHQNTQPTIILNYIIKV
jgi:microcystin-dependent protein